MKQFQITSGLPNMTQNVNFEERKAGVYVEVEELVLWLRGCSQIFKAEIKQLRNNSGPASTQQIRSQLVEDLASQLEKTYKKEKEDEQN